MNSFRSLVSTTLVAALAATASAQGPDVVGLTSTSPFVITQDTASCAIRRCLPPIGPAVAPWAGGTAHDASDGGTWITDGLVLAKVDTRNQCLVICPPQPIPFLGAGVVVTGLAFNERTRMLFMTLSNNIIHTFAEQNCQLNLVARCIFPAPAGHVLTAAGTDDITGMIYVATSPMLPGPVIVNGVIYQAPQTAPCAPICRYVMPDCTGAPMRVITGLGYEPCTGVLYGTDGMNVTGMRILPNCQSAVVSCCPPVIPAPDTYVGLDVIPRPARPVGTSCTGNPCPACPTMRHVTTGDPVIGNATFSLDLVSAPANSNSWLALNVGNCTPTGPTFGFCGPILVGPGPIVIGAIPTGPGAGCSGTSSFPLAIPAAPTLCGVPFATQYIGLCVTSVGVGTFVSNCLDWTIQGS